MDLLGVLAVFIGVFLVTTAVNPGLKLRISQPGLDYAAKQAVSAISADIHGKVIPDIHGEDHTKVGKVKYDLTSMVVTSFTAPSTKVSIQPGQGASFSIINVGATVHGNWHYEYKKIIKIRDHGTFDVTVSGASIAMGVTLGIDSLTSGRPTIKTTMCSSNVAKVKVKFHHGASWLYNIFDHQAAKLIKSNLQKTICKSATEAINVKGAQKLAKTKVQVPLGDIGILDYRLVQAPVFGSGYAETYHKGEVFWKGNSTEAPFTPAPLPEPPQTSRMLTIWLSDYLMNTMGKVMHDHDVLKFSLTAADLPEKDRGILNTTCSDPKCFGNLLPKVKSIYPNCSIAISMSSTTAPSLQIIPDLLQGHFEGEMTFYAVMPNGTQAFLLKTLMVVNMNLTAGISDDKVTAKVTSLKPNIKVNSSAIGFVSDAVMNLLFTFAAKSFIVPKLNEVGEKGIDLPALDGVKYTNTDINLLQNAFCLSTDVIVSSLSFKPKYKFVNDLHLGKM